MPVPQVDQGILLTAFRRQGQAYSGFGDPALSLSQAGLLEARGHSSRTQEAILSAHVAEENCDTLLKEGGSMLMLARCVAVLALGALYLCAQEEASPKGVHPRATPDDYAVEAQGKGAAYAASLVPVEQAKQLFAFDITGKFLVFEVAYFPKDNQWATLDTDDFVIKRGGKGDLSHVADATAVASAIQRESAPKHPESLGTSDTHVSTEAHVGYESGRNPVTGQPVHGTYSGAGVGVEQGGPPAPPASPRPGASSEDRKMLETQLRDRQLPSGKFDHAVAGYLYFPKATVKKDGSGNYVLEHLGETNSAGVSETVDLVIPAKNR